jgi:hypothetical protein
LLSPDGSALFPYQGKGPALKLPNSVSALLQRDSMC